MARIGEIIDGKYEILREVGRGGMSIVYLAMDKRLNKQWAVKEIKRQGSNENNQIVMQSLLAEANLMKKLDHPTLPRIVDILEYPHTIYVIMDYIEGEVLERVLKAYGAQPEAAVVEWGKQLCDALDYLHTRTPAIIYRDMKPGNVMLKPDGTIKLFDFGIAREYKEGNREDTVCLGTKGYAAPEQYGGKGQTDARTDIYCLGVTLYHLVTGKNPCEPPYELYPIRHWDPSLSSGLEWVIQKCTQLNPADRFQSCAELRYVLDNLERFDTAYRTRQKRKIRWFAASCTATALSLAIGIGSLFMKQYQDSKNYELLLTQGNYAAAIEQFPDRPDAYEKYMDTNYYDTETITPELKEEFQQYASGERLGKLKQSNPDVYAEFLFSAGCICLFDEGYLTDNTTDYTTAIKFFRQTRDVMGDANYQHINKTFLSVILNIDDVSNANSNAKNSSRNEDTNWAENWQKIEDAIAGIGELDNSKYREIKLQLYQKILNSVVKSCSKYIADPEVGVARIANCIRNLKSTVIQLGGGDSTIINASFATIESKLGTK